MTLEIALLIEFRLVQVFQKPIFGKPDQALCLLAQVMQSNLDQPRYVRGGWVRDREQSGKDLRAIQLCRDVVARPGPQVGDIASDSLNLVGVGQRQSFTFERFNAAAAAGRLDPACPEAGPVIVQLRAGRYEPSPCDLYSGSLLRRRKTPPIRS